MPRFCDWNSNLNSDWLGQNWQYRTTQSYQKNFISTSELKHSQLLHFTGSCESLHLDLCVRATAAGAVQRSRGPGSSHRSWCYPSLFSLSTTLTTKNGLFKATWKSPSPSNFSGFFNHFKTLTVLEFLCCCESLPAGSLVCMDKQIYTRF